MPETRAPSAADTDPVVDLVLQEAFLAWLTRYRGFEPDVHPTEMLRDAFTYAYFAGRFAAEGSR